MGYSMSNRPLSNQTFFDLAQKFFIFFNPLKNIFKNFFNFFIQPQKNYDFCKNYLLFRKINLKSKFKKVNFNLWLF